MVQKLVKKHLGNNQIKQITEEVGITRQGFYEHYRSVDEAILKGSDKMCLHVTFEVSIEGLIRLDTDSTNFDFRSKIAPILISGLNLHQF